MTSIIMETGSCNIFLVRVVEICIAAVLAPSSKGDTFWITMADHMMRGISGPLVSYILMETSNEATVRSFLIESVIRELARHLSNLPRTTSRHMYFIHCISVHGACCSPPWMTGAVSVCGLLNEKMAQSLVLYLGRQKIVISEKDIKKLSTYMWKIATSAEYKKVCCWLFNGSPELLYYFCTTGIYWQKSSTYLICIWRTSGTFVIWWHLLTPCWI